MDEISSREAVLAGWREKRPVLHHLTGDACWLLSIPRPTGSRQWYHLQIDSWILGYDSNGPFGFLGRFALVSGVGLNGYEDVNALCKRIEEMTPRFKGLLKLQEVSTSYLDAVLISHTLNDHLSVDTLKTYPHDIPVFGSPSAYPRLKGLKRFDNIAQFGVETDEDGPSPLWPSWLGINWIETPGDKDKILSSIVITVDRTASGRSNIKRDAIIYVMHHQEPELLDRYTSDPSTNILALLHPTSPVSVPVVSVMLKGAEEGLEMIRSIQPKWWIANHDDTYTITGLTYYLFTKVKMTVADALRMESERDEKPQRDLEGTTFADVPAGGAIALV